MEVSQAIWLALFMVDALLISPKRFDEIILDFYQDAGIWIVIASCVAEYLLLLTYIGVAAYDFFKNRKMMKKMNVQRRTYEFLKFDESHRDVGNRLIKPGGRSQAAPHQFQRAKIVITIGKFPRNPLRTPKYLAMPVNRPVENLHAPNNPQLLKFDGDRSYKMKKPSIATSLLPVLRRKKDE